MIFNSIKKLVGDDVLPGDGSIFSNFLGMFIPLLIIGYRSVTLTVVALICTILSGIINIWWKVSTHMASMGGLTGTVVAFSFLFMFNPIPMMCVMLILAGFMGTARMILRQHTLSQVIGGFTIGFISALVFILVGW